MKQKPARVPESDPGLSWMGAFVIVMMTSLTRLDLRYHHRQSLFASPTYVPVAYIMTDSNNQNQNPDPDSNNSDSESSHHITITIPKNSKVKIIITPNTSPPNRGRGKSGAEKCLTHESKKINVENVEEVNPGPFDHHPSCPMDQD